jgi:hypothetical protein
MVCTERLERDATAARLNRIARIDGFSVRAAKSKAQLDAWCAPFAIFKGDTHAA